MAMKKHKEATAQEQSCAVASFLFFRVERTDQNEDSADHIDCRDRSRARRPLGSSGSALVEEGGFEPPKLTQQIYSLPPLATRELLHMKLELVDGFEPPTC